MTKKILLAMAFVASVAACTDDYKDWADPQAISQPREGFPLCPVSAISRTALANSAKSSDYQNANSIFAIGGVRLTMSPNNHFKLCVTPEYHGAISKDETCKLVSANDTTMKKWTTGFNLSAGLVFYF